MMESKRLYTPQLSEANVRNLYQQAKRFEMPMSKMLNLIVSTALEELAEVDDPNEWQTAIPVRSEESQA